MSELEESLYFMVGFVPVIIFSVKPKMAVTITGFCSLFLMGEEGLTINSETSGALVSIIMD
ncbi:MAG: hypothetical protein KAR45_18790 [Desulfobacteraceae bacterium]|nr:hypothetical protein [Desulfobacteraceae bacterium]